MGSQSSLNMVVIRKGKITKPSCDVLYIEGGSKLYIIRRYLRIKEGTHYVSRKEVIYIHIHADSLSITKTNIC